MDGIGSGCGRVGAVSVWHDAGQPCGDVAEYASRGGKACGDHSGYVGGKYSDLRYVLVTRKPTGGVRHRGSAGGAHAAAVYSGHSGDMDRGPDEMHRGRQALSDNRGDGRVQLWRDTEYHKCRSKNSNDVNAKGERDGRIFITRSICGGV